MKVVQGPDIREIKGGWAALGDGWAVHARTKDEAIRRYNSAVEKRTEISRRPDPTETNQKDSSTES